MATNVVETNILAVANGLAAQANADCVFSAKSLLYNIVAQNQCVSIDAAGQIFGEYKRYAHFSGQPAEGDLFLKWLLSNFGNAQCCEFVDTSPEPPIPDGFDPSDRKFLWAALLSQKQPATIHNAVDSDWEMVGLFLQQNRIALNQIC